MATAKKKDTATKGKWIPPWVKNAKDKKESAKPKASPKGKGKK